MNRARWVTGWVLISLALFGCAGPRSQFDREIGSVPSTSEQRSGTARPPVVLHSGSETASYSYATGCYQAYERICGKLLTDSQKDVCRQDGLSVCEHYAHEFGEWIRSGSVRK